MCVCGITRKVVFLLAATLMAEEGGTEDIHYTLFRLFASLSILSLSPPSFFVIFFFWKCFSKRIISGPWDLSLLIDTLNFFLFFFDEGWTTTPRHQDSRHITTGERVALFLPLSSTFLPFHLPIITDTLVFHLKKKIFFFYV